MSYREEKIKSLIASDYTDFNTRKLQDHCSSILERGMHACVLALMKGYKNQGVKLN